MVLFDGACGLCDRLVRFVLPRDPRGVFRFAPLQGEWARAALARHGEDANDLDTVWVVRDAETGREGVLARAAAARFVLARLAWPWPALAVLGILPRPLLDALYDLVARFRHRLFGRLDLRRPPPDAFRGRFLG